ncbi:hypothetical protein J4558_04455 [Leptolyngbya sp. 15MV]|jgi:hypothetical protein|nr:hypothetical protein J4558_04455 [Leptolyngbya sp. 15MV]
MEIATILIALVLIFIAWKVLTGLIKFGLIALVVIGAFYFLSQGGAL